MKDLVDFDTFFRQCTIVSNTEQGILVSHPAVKLPSLGETTLAAVDKLYEQYRQSMKHLLFAFIYAQ